MKSTAHHPSWFGSRADPRASTGAAARTCLSMLGLLALLASTPACDDAGESGRARDAGDPATASDANDEDAQASPAADECESVADGERCGDGDYCRAERCESNRCGDDFRAGGESCDDGNQLAGDGCDPACQLELPECGDGELADAEECDDGNWIDQDACSNLCTANECGNGRVDPEEECDDANLIDDDGCAHDCLLWECRNGRVDPGEECDDGNTVDVGDGCTNACQVTICGNGKLEKYETCDDGNRVDGDDCPSRCVYAVCGDGLVEPLAGEACDGSRIVKEGDAPGEWRGCSADCTRRLAPEQDGCGKCLQERCTNFQEADLVGGCFDEPNVAQLGADATNPNYIQHCIEVVNCALLHGCGFEADLSTRAPDPALCYCGSATTDDCARDGPAADAPCAAEWRSAARAASNEEVLTRFTDPIYPLGVAYTLLQCFGTPGPDTCGVQCSSYCQRTRDAQYCNADGTPRAL